MSPLPEFSFSILVRKKLTGKSENGMKNVKMTVVFKNFFVHILCDTHFFFIRRVLFLCQSVLEC